MQTAHHLARSLDHADVLVRDAVLVAHRLHVLPRLTERVARHVGEEMVLDLLVQAASEPVVERGAVDVARRQHLVGEEILLEIFVEVHRHAIVALDEHVSEEEATDALRGDVVEEALREGTVGGNYTDKPRVVQHHSNHLLARRLDILCECRVRALHHADDLEQGHERPRHASEEQDGGNEVVLVAHDHLVHGRVHLNGRLELLAGPREDGKRVDVGVNGHELVVKQVGGCVVRVVLVLPPADAEALHDVSPKETHDPVASTVRVNLVVAVVVREPATLLPEEPEHARRREQLRVASVAGEQQRHA